MEVGRLMLANKWRGDIEFTRVFNGNIYIYGDKAQISIEVYTFLSSYLEFFSQ